MPSKQPIIAQCTDQPQIHKNCRDIIVVQNIGDSVSNDVQEAAKEAQPKQANPEALKVCILTADFWGLKSAGGTATAYHLLAAVLAKSPNLHVSPDRPRNIRLNSTCAQLSLQLLQSLI